MKKTIIITLTMLLLNSFVSGQWISPSGGSDNFFYFYGFTVFNDPYFTNESNVISFNETKLNSTIDARSGSGSVDTRWSITGPYIYNNSGSLDINEVNLNNTIDARASSISDTNESSRVNNIVSTNCTGQVVAGFYSNGSGYCEPDNTGGGGGDRWSIIDNYLYNNTGSLDVNETKLNNTIITITDERDSNTQYTAGTGLSLNIQEFNLAWTSLSQFTDDLGNRGYNSLSNFTNDQGYYNFESNLTFLLDDNYLGITDQRYNETSYVDAVNTTVNIETLGFTTGTHTVDTDTRWSINTTVLVNQSGTLGLNNTGVRITESQILDLSHTIDTNESPRVTALVSSNSTTNNRVTSVNSSLQTQITQQQNDNNTQKAEIDAKHTPGTCPVGQAVQNTTTSGVECFTPAGGSDTNESVRVNNIVDNACSVGNFIFNFSQDGTPQCDAPAGSGDITAVYSNASLIGGGASGDINLSINMTYLDLTFATDSQTSADNSTQASEISTLDTRESANNNTQKAEIDLKLDITDQRYNDTTYFTNGTGITLLNGQFNHSDTSSVADSDNSGRTYIQDLLFDKFGHVLTVVTATETVTDTQIVTDASYNASVFRNEGGNLGIVWTLFTGVFQTITQSNADNSTQASLITTNINSISTLDTRESANNATQASQISSNDADITQLQTDNSTQANYIDSLIASNTTQDSLFYDSTEAATFTTINTGQGANELYPQNQSMLTTDDVIYNSVNTTQYNFQQSGCIRVSGSQIIIDGDGNGC